jgi:hypothetical protein
MPSLKSAFLLGADRPAREAQGVDRAYERLMREFMVGLLWPKETQSPERIGTLGRRIASNLTGESSALSYKFAARQWDAQDYCGRLKLDGLIVLFELAGKALEGTASTLTCKRRQSPCLASQGGSECDARRWPRDPARSRRYCRPRGPPAAKT